jgi:peptide/nickel transport system substrate-binding protein
MRDNTDADLGKAAQRGISQAGGLMIGNARSWATAGLAVVCATALAACGSSTGAHVQGLKINGTFGSVPAPATGAEHGGVVTVGAPPSTAANWAMPLITGADNSVFTVLDFDYQMYRPLYWTNNGIYPTYNAAMSLADLPVVSNNDKTYTITLKSNYKWSNGQPITSQDVLFWYDEMKAAIAISPANWADYTPGLGIPDQVASVTTPNSSTIVFTMKTSVNPGWLTYDVLGGIQPWPIAWESMAGSGLNFTNPTDATTIYNYVSKASSTLSTYATDPLWQIVDGPYKLTSFDSTNSAFTMAPNTSYGGPESKAPPTIKLEPFTSDVAEVNAVKAHQIDVGYVPTTDLPEMPSIESGANGYNAFGAPTFGWTYIAYNFKDTTGDFNNIIGQLYIRQALAHLEDESGYIKAFLGGAGGQAYGPVPSIPATPYTPSNAVTDPYPFSLGAATTLLKDHGWTVTAGGTDTCAKPGTGSNECGAGIPAGTKLAWTLYYGTSPASIGQETQAWASEAAKAGIKITLRSSNFNYLVQNYNDPAAPSNDSKWAMEDFGGFTDSTYPTTFGVFNSAGSANLGGYANKQADSLITASISSSNPDAVKAEASFLTTNQPGLFQPNPDAGGNGSCVIVWSKSMSGSTDSFANLTQFLLTPEFWYFTK